jgi:N-acetylglucosamine-6-phosphate deacetylase
MAAQNPACLLGIGDSRGSIEPGKRADLVAIDGEGNVKFTMVGGHLLEPPAVAGG